MAEVTDERLRNTRVWAQARVGSLSGAEVIVAACDEALAARAATSIEEAATIYDSMQGGYITYSPNPGMGNAWPYMTLDGDFSAEQLRAMALLMDKAPEKLIP